MVDESEGSKGRGRPFPHLETKRLVLRRMTLDDVGFYFRHFSDPDIVERTGYEAPADLGAAREEFIRYIIRPFDEGTGIRWGITLKGHGELIGTLGYYEWVREGAQRAMMGYDLAAPHRRQGIMTEAMAAAIDHGFGSMALHRISALVDSRNLPSQRLLLGLGFTREGVLRGYTQFRGKFLDDVCFSLLRPEWKFRGPGTG